MQIKPSSAQAGLERQKLLVSLVFFLFVHRSETQQPGEREKDEKINTKIWKFSVETNMADKETFTLKAPEMVHVSGSAIFIESSSAFRMAARSYVKCRRINYSSWPLEEEKLKIHSR
jgi:hypothetical protein